MPKYGRPKCPFISTGNRARAPTYKTWFLGAIRLRIPNGSSIGSSVFAGLINLIDIQTDHATSAAIDRILMLCMRCGLNSSARQHGSQARPP